MPIKIPDGLPGRVILEQERVPLILEERARRQDIRPLQIAILNLMPDKITTEVQLLRSLGATPLQIEITLLQTSTHSSRNTSQAHLDAFYKTWKDVADRNFDALIVTGAPVEHLPFRDVDYWDEFAGIMEWARTHVFSSFFICWGAQAALYHYNNIEKFPLPAKKSGVYHHKVAAPFEPLLTGFDDSFHVPVSRNTETRRQDIENHKDFIILAESDDSGLFLLYDRKHRRVFSFNHLEYDADTLQREYTRDKKAGSNPQIPHNYFPQDNPEAAPRITWRAHRSLLFNNWINLVYQGTPYDLAAMPDYVWGGARYTP
jgi:homoserine O-succinyltransferase/O-acetyltransferase